VGRQGAIRQHRQQRSIASRDDQELAVRQPVDAERERLNAADDLAVAREIDRNQLLGTPIAKPQSPVVPAR
jgi:hypothetical protein